MAVGEAALAADLIRVGNPFGEAALAADLITALQREKKNRNEYSQLAASAIYHFKSIKSSSEP